MSATLKVNTKEIIKNICNIKKKIKPAKFCAVVKANSYGVGIELCKYIDGYVDYFAVANIFEANNLAKLTNKPILVLSPPDIEEIKQIDAKNIEFAVDQIETAKFLANFGKEFKVHIAVNTGMNRFGVKFEEYKKIFKILINSKNKVVGVFSHFWGEKQSEQVCQDIEFEKYVQYAKSVDQNIICHISNSCGINFLHDMVRIGIGLYCQNDFSCLSLCSSISKIQDINAGEVVGYGANYIADKKRKIAVIKIGYADGILRRMVGAKVLINKFFCTIVAVCMDAILVDVSFCGAKVGDMCIFFGKMGKKKISVCNLAQYCDTISYEILTSIGQRVKREYII